MIDGDTFACGPSGCFASVPPETPWLGQLRVCLRSFLHDVAPGSLDDVLLVVTELATNAAVHGQAPVEVRLQRRDSAWQLRIEVCDGATRLPPDKPVMEATDAPCGRGLRLIDALCTAWGVVRHEHGDGKTVWAELPTRQVTAG